MASVRGSVRRINKAPDELRPPPGRVLPLLLALAEYTVGLTFALSKAMESGPTSFAIRLVLSTVFGKTSGGPHSRSPFLEETRAIAVVIEDLEPGATDAGVTREWLRATLEQRLSRSGIPLMPFEKMELLQSISYPKVPIVLGVHIDAKQDDSTGLLGGNYRLVLMETQDPLRGRSKNEDAIWFKKGSIRSATRKGFKKALADITSESLSQFIMSFRRENAKL